MAFFLPDLYPLVDFTRPYTFLDKEFEQLFPQARKGRRSVDKLAKVWLKDGHEQWILIHTEVQSHFDATFSERMFSYFYRIYDKYHQQIAAIVVLADKRSDWKPDTFHLNFANTQLTYTYPVYKIFEQDELLLREMNNPFAFVIQAALYTLRYHEMGEDFKYQFKLELTRLLFKKGYEAAKIKAVFLFIHTLLQMQAGLTQALFFEEVKKMATQNKNVELLSDFEKVALRKGEKKGEKRGEKRGEKKNQKNTALKMKAKGFELPLISELTGLSQAEVEAL
ncbi:MAG: hypothetical protein AB7I41_10990 [Candidatus Sericytochromatia bacterium]